MTVGYITAFFFGSLFGSIVYLYKNVNQIPKKIIGKLYPDQNYDEIADKILNKVYSKNSTE